MKNRIKGDAWEYWSVRDGRGKKFARILSSTEVHENMIQSEISRRESVVCVFIRTSSNLLLAAQFMPCVCMRKTCSCAI